ncbi:GH3 family domain-containing protein [Falsiroseomonas selenitidurans]|uniref:GH3 auxin-responsive promoter family protein n=1 Tax=Falsiroseomonas selenitidurans TaxID=2716335 RepID=A0ABX1E2T6_9PROT|nr:GH3 auxin-responsive promoter family protein [Falsiroseomonas selenitidurans]NKC31063.1 GH3 auxin-responsive promoter family protein [Falsiroseomonas selenitidurans]
MPSAHEATLRLLHGAWRLAATRETRRFAAAAAALEASQAGRLLHMLRRNAGTVLGRRHRFESITSVAEYRRRVPVVGYDELRDLITRIAAGERDVLTAGGVRMLERTSGSTAAGKLIPYTNDLRAEFERAATVWIAGVLRDVPAVRGLRTYISISPLHAGPRRTEGGIPIGLDDDTGYLSPVARLAARLSLVGSGALGAITDPAAWRDATARALLEADDLGLISVWSPDFLTLLLDHVAAHWDRLLAGLPPGRRRVLSRLSAPEPARIWPRLAMVSCWTDAQASAPADQLRARLPGIAIEPKGLMATEGVVSVPIRRGLAPVLAVTSHVFEFIDLSRPATPPLLAHELRAGGDYSPVLTTGGGFHRYHLRDAVRCEGHWHAAPLLRFRGKLDGVADLRGEKLDPVFATEVVTRALAETALPYDFALLAPTEPAGIAGYTLFVESPAAESAIAQLAEHVERLLRDSRHYRLCRDLGQLRPVEAERVHDGRRRRMEVLVDAGMRLGDIKPALFDPRPGLAEALRRGGPSPADRGPA